MFIVEILTGSSEQGNAMLFDSVWTSEALALEYCLNRYKDWEYSITSVSLNQGS